MMLEIIKGINQAENILIFTHENPDGDAIGSCLALMYALKSMGKKVNIILEDKPAEIFSPFSKYFYLKEDILKSQFDLKISLDCGEYHRLGSIRELFFGNTINIDHHHTNSNFAKINYVDAKSAACGEIIFKLLNKMKINITKEIADAIYFAILTDTGGFMYSNTTATTHEIIAKTIELGADHYELNKWFFLKKSYKRQKITAKSIDIMEFYYNNKIAISAFTYDICQANGMTPDDINGLSAVPGTVIGVEVGVLIVEFEKDKLKVSLRSDKLIDVSTVAASFGGGGHKRASGFNKIGDINELKQEILKVLKAEFEKVEN